MKQLQHSANAHVCVVMSLSFYLHHKRTHKCNALGNSARPIPPRFGGNNSVTTPKVPRRRRRCETEELRPQNSGKKIETNLCLRIRPSFVCLDAFERGGATGANLSKSSD